MNAIASNENHVDKRKKECYNEVKEEGGDWRHES